MVANIRASNAEATYRLSRRPLCRYRHSRMRRVTAQNIIMMSLRPNRLKYSRAGESVSITAAMSAPCRPMWSRRK